MVRAEETASLPHRPRDEWHIDLATSGTGCPRAARRSVKVTRSRADAGVTVANSFARVSTERALGCAVTAEVGRTYANVDLGTRAERCRWRSIPTTRSTSRPTAALPRLLATDLRARRAWRERFPLSAQCRCFGSLAAMPVGSSKRNRQRDCLSGEPPARCRNHAAIRTRRSSGCSAGSASVLPETRASWG